MATSEKYSSSLIEIQTQWSWQDIVDAHVTLNLYDAEYERQRKQAEAQRPKGRK